ARSPVEYVEAHQHIIAAIRFVKVLASRASVSGPNAAETATLERPSVCDGRSRRGIGRKACQRKLDSSHFAACARPSILEALGGPRERRGNDGSSPDV